MTFNPKEYAAKWKAEHREHINEYMRKWRAEHIEESRKSWAKYRAKHRKEINKRAAKYRAEHREEIRNRNLKVYVEKKKMILSYNIKWLQEHWCYRDDKFYCPECGEEIDITQVHNHHIEPESKLFNICEWPHYSFEQLEEELVKTKPICPQCHKKITAEQRNYHVFKELNTMTNAELVVKFAEYVPGYKRRR